MTTYQLRPQVSRTDGSIAAGDVEDRAIDRVLLGALAESGAPRNVYLDLSGEQVVGIVGKRGTGKSYTLGVLLEGLACAEGRTRISDRRTPRGALLLDLMDVFWSSVTSLTPDGPPQVQAQWERLGITDPEEIPMGVDIWVPGGYESEIDMPGTRSLTLTCWQLTAEDWARLMDVDLVNEPRGQLLFELLHKVGNAGWADETSDHLPNDTYQFQDLLQCIDNDSELGRSYNINTRNAVRQRLVSYSLHSLFAEDGTQLRELIRPWNVSVLLLRRLEGAMRDVLVSILVQRIMRERQHASFARKRLDLGVGLTEEETERLSQAERDSIPRTWILIDEAHNLAPTGERGMAGEALVKYAKEGRNMGLSLAVATQQPNAIDTRLMSQVETFVVHQLTAASDIAIAAKNLRSPEPAQIVVDGRDSDLAGLIRQLDRGVALVSSANGKTLERACVTAVRPRITAHGGYEA